MLARSVNVPDVGGLKIAWFCQQARRQEPPRGLMTFLLRARRPMMRPLMAILALALAPALAACTKGHSPDTSSSTAATKLTIAAPDDAVATVTRLEREWVAAIVKKDTKALERLLADDFTGTSATSHRYNKNVALSDLATGTYIVDDMDLWEISVNAYGDVAVAFASQWTLRLHRCVGKKKRTVASRYVPRVAVRDALETPRIMREFGRMVVAHQRPAEI
jgi:hypothetical protein